MKQHDVAPAVCPSCGAEHDGATNLGRFEERSPTHGDFSVCFECGATLRFESVAAFGNRLRLVAARPEELERLGKQGREQLLAVQTRIRQRYS